MKIPGTVDLVLYCLVALGGAGLLFTVNHWRAQAAEYKVAKVEWKQKLAAKEKQLTDEREETRKSNEASNLYQGRIRDLENQRVADQFPSISVCRRPVIRLQAPGADSGGPDAAAVPGDTGAAEVSVDVGPAADLYGTHCEANTIQLEELLRRLRNR